MYVEKAQQCSLALQQVFVCLSFAVFLKSLNTKEHIWKNKTKCFCKCCFTICINWQSEKKSTNVFEKVLYVVVLFIFLKNFVGKARTKFINKKNVTKAQRMKPLEAVTNLYIKPPSLTQIVSTFLSKILLDWSNVAFWILYIKQFDIFDSYQIFCKMQKIFSIILRCSTAGSTTLFLKKLFCILFYFYDLEYFISK